MPPPLKSIKKSISKIYTLTNNTVKIRQWRKFCNLRCCHLETPFSVILLPRAWRAHLQQTITCGNVKGKCCVIVFVGPHGAIGSFSHFHCLLLTIMPLRPFTGAWSMIWPCACDVWCVVELLSNFCTEAASEFFTFVCCVFLLDFSPWFIQSNADVLFVLKNLFLC